MYYIGDERVVVVAQMKVMQRMGLKSNMRQYAIWLASIAGVTVALRGKTYGSRWSALFQVEHEQ